MYRRPLDVLDTTDSEEEVNIVPLTHKKLGWLTNTYALDGTAGDFTVRLGKEKEFKYISFVLKHFQYFKYIHSNFLFIFFAQKYVQKWNKKGIKKYNIDVNPKNR